jgi:hypothetical protein
MNHARALFADLFVEGVEIRVSRGKLIFKAKPGVLTPEIKKALIRNKVELVSIVEKGPSLTWAEWQAAMLNYNFRHHGAIGDRCKFRFTAEDVLAGERARSSRERVDGRCNVEAQSYKEQLYKVPIEKQPIIEEEPTF